MQHEDKEGMVGNSGKRADNNIRLAWHLHRAIDVQVCMEVIVWE
jgi:hypothetical protein